MNVDKFITFLRISGAQILEPTNEYELVRFRTQNGVSVMYKSKRGHTFTGEAREAYDKFDKKSIWHIRGRSEKVLERAHAELIARDGTDCFFCGCATVKGENRTIEHLLPISDGGNNNMKNICIACRDCNTAVGNMPIVDKVRFYIKKHPKFRVHDIIARPEIQIKFPSQRRKRKRA